MVLAISNAPYQKLLIPDSGMSAEEFTHFCEANSEWQIERDSKGDIVVRSPSLEDAGIRNADVAAQLGAWAKVDKAGKALGSCMGYALPNGATRCPDASWISMERLKKYIDCGALLGWLIDPYSTKVNVYRPGHRTKSYESPKTVSADPVLPGFTLDLTDIGDIGF